MASLGHLSDLWVGGLRGRLRRVRCFVVTPIPLRGSCNGAGDSGCGKVCRSGKSCPQGLVRVMK